MLSTDFISRGFRARIALGLAVAAGLAFSLSAQAGEGGDDKSLYLQIDPIVTNLSPVGRGMALKKAVKLIAPFAPDVAPPRKPTPEELAAQAEQQVEQMEATRGVPLPIDSGAKKPAATSEADNDAEADASNNAYDDGSPHYARIALTLRFPTAQAKEEAKPYMPEIKSRVILLLSSRDPSQLQTAVQKQAFSNALTRLLRAPDAKDLPPRELSGAFITDFIIQ